MNQPVHPPIGRAGVAPHPGRDAILDALRRTTARSHEILGEIARDERGATAFLARELTSGELTVLKVEEQRGDDGTLTLRPVEFRELGAAVPAPDGLCPTCEAPLRGWQRRCEVCRSDVGGVAQGSGPGASRGALLAAARRLVAGRFEVLGDMRRVGDGGIIYFARALASEQLVTFRLVPQGTMPDGGIAYALGATQFLSPLAVTPRPSDPDTPAQAFAAPLADPLVASRAGSGDPNAVVAPLPPSPHKVCRECGREFTRDINFCPQHGAVLELIAPSSGLIGSVIDGRYRILEHIGHGGMGEVFLALQLRTERKCALKVMHETLTHDAEAVARFRREPKNVSNISHQNIATVFDSGDLADGTPYFAMEYVDGKPLSAVIAESVVIPALRAADIARKIAEGLAAAHEHGIIHRDLKPENVIIGRSRDGRDIVKVVDFGIAKPVQGNTSTLTRLGYLIGTAAYMSPEHIRGGHLDGRTDLYSLGCVLYEMLTGRPTIEAATPEAVIGVRLTQKTPPRPRKIRRDVPRSLDDITAKLLAYSPDDRYQSAAEAATALATPVATAGGGLFDWVWKDLRNIRLTSTHGGAPLAPGRDDPTKDAGPAALGPVVRQMPKDEAAEHARSSTIDARDVPKSPPVAFSSQRDLRPQLRATDVVPSDATAPSPPAPRPGERVPETTAPPDTGPEATSETPAAESIGGSVPDDVSDNARDTSSDAATDATAQTRDDKDSFTNIWLKYGVRVPRAQDAPPASADSAEHVGDDLAAGEERTSAVDKTEPPSATEPVNATAGAMRDAVDPPPRIDGAAAPSKETKPADMLPATRETAAGDASSERVHPDVMPIASPVVPVARSWRSPRVAAAAVLAASIAVTIAVMDPRGARQWIASVLRPSPSTDSGGPGPVVAKRDTVLGGGEVIKPPQPRAGRGGGSARGGDSGSKTTGPASPPVVTPPVKATSDSAAMARWQPVRDAADGARRRALSAGATVQEMAIGNALVHDAERAYASPSARTRAFAIIESAAKEYARVEQAARARKAAPTATVPSIPGAAPKVSIDAPPSKLVRPDSAHAVKVPAIEERTDAAAARAAKAEADAELAAKTAGVDSTLRHYVGLISAGDLAGMLALFPGMPRDVQKGYDDLFAQWRDHSTSGVTITGTTVAGDTAGADLRYVLKFHDPSNGDRETPLQVHATLHREPRGWRIDRLDKK